MNIKHIGLVGVGVLALLLTACTPAVTGPDQADGPAPAGDAECIAAVEADVNAGMEPSELVVPAEPLDLAALAGKNIWYITNSHNQFSTEMATGVEEAGAASGVKITVFDGQNSTAKYSEGINQAIAQNADGIVLMAIQPAVVKEDLAAAEAAGIKVLNTLNGDPSETVPASTFANLSADYTKDGELMGKWALLDSGCTANIVVVQSSPVHVWDLAANGIVSAVEKFCPEDCTVKVLDIDPANIATETGTQLQTALQVDAEVDYVLPVWDSAMPLVAPVVASSGTNAKVLAHDGITASLEMIAEGQDQDGTVAMPPPGWIGWAAFDQVARAVLGVTVPDYVIPTRLVNTSNIGDGSIADVSPNYQDYQGAFESAWAK